MKRKDRKKKKGFDVFSLHSPVYSQFIFVFKLINPCISIVINHAKNKCYIYAVAVCRFLLFNVSLKESP